MRALILLHRYVGIGIGWLMSVWCLSGIVMLYKPYPRVGAQARVESLAPLDWARVSQLAERVAGSDTYSRFQLETLAGSPVLRLWPVDGRMQLLQLRPPAGESAIDEPQAIDTAVRYARREGRQASAPTAKLISYDQWTVGGSRRDRPIYRVEIGDAAGAEVYVSSHSGMVIQATTRAQRFWGWLGAVPHWLYVSSLRSRPQVWTQVVIWTSVTGVFLTVIGLVIGIRALTQSARLNRYSPYKGLMLWHHLVGLVFGIFALTWVLSGLFSMNPWGLMEGADPEAAEQRLAGKAPAGADIQGALRALAAHPPAGIVAINSAPLNGALFLIATRSDGTRIRYDAQGRLRQLTNPDISAAVARLTESGAAWTLLRTDDAYHYGVASERTLLPVIRAVSPKGDYFYLDPVSAELVDRADSGDRAYRWWFSALHRWDFAPALRTSLGRTVVVLPVLLGTALLTCLGAYLGIRRLIPRRVSGAPRLPVPLRGSPQ